MKTTNGANLDITTRLVDGGVQRHRVPPGVTWTLGRSLRADVQVPHTPSVSQIALMVRNRMVSSRGVQHNAIGLVVVQRGSARVQVEGGSGDLMQIAAGAPELLLRLSEHYVLRLFTPGLVAELEFTTPAIQDPVSAKSDSHGTETWTIGSQGINPAWVDVAAMAVLIFKHAEIIPVRPNGKPASHSEAFALAVEIFVGHSSNEFRKRNLKLALERTGVYTAPGQDRLGRVAQQFDPFFDARKIAELAAQMKEPLEDLWRVRGRI